MCFHGNQVSWGINHSFISIYFKYQPLSFICSCIMLAPVISSLDEIYCMSYQLTSFEFEGKNYFLRLYRHFAGDSSTLHSHSQLYSQFLTFSHAFLSYTCTICGKCNNLPNIELIHLQYPNKKH